MRKVLMIVVGCLGLLMPILCGVTIATGSEKTMTVAVLPFEVLSQEDLSFLGKGVSRMVCSRIGDSMEIRVQCSVPGIPDYGNSMSLEVLRSLREEKEFQRIDYLVRGTIIVAGSGVSTDVELIDLLKGSVRARFHEAGNSQEDVLLHASLIAGKIKNTLLGKPLDDPSSMGIYKKNRPFSGDVKTPGRQAATGVSVFSPKVTSESDLPGAPGQVFRSRSFDTRFCGLTVGDVDGDGFNDIIIIDDHTLMVFSLENGALSQKSAFKGNYYETMKSVDVADINGNGRAEIFVSVVGRSGRLKSFVTEWDGGRFTSLAAETNWYYRIIKIDGKARLFGQKGSHSGYFSGKVHALDWNGSGYASTGVPPFKPGSAIFSFSVGNVFKDDGLQFLMHDRDGYLNLFDASGRSVWISNDSFGSTPFYLEKGSSRHYINGRILVSDISGDTRPEVIVARNHDMSKGYLGRFRKFNRGSVKAFGWNGRSMELLWETSEIKGYVADVAVEDLDRDGRPELIYAVGVDSGKLFRTRNSYVIVEKTR